MSQSKNESPPPRRGGQPGNTNAAKPPAEVASSYIYIRCTAAQKAAYVRAANARAAHEPVKPGLAEFVLDTLDRAAARTLKKYPPR